MLAAEQGNLEIVQELLKKGANCNLEDAVSISVLCDGTWQWKKKKFQGAGDEWEFRLVLSQEGIKQVENDDI